MNNLLKIFAALFFSVFLYAETVSVMTFNVENLFDNKNDAEAFVNDYIDCVINKKTIKKEEYTISYSKGKWEVKNKKGQYYRFRLSMFYKKTFEVLRESLKFME